MRKANIEVEPGKCTQCHCCQLRCSLAFTGDFNPEKARIIIDPPDRIVFTDECLMGCSLCVRYCPYGAISLRKKSGGS
jgi:Fe-S-cluster-containing hydrogenase component 2